MIINKLKKNLKSQQSPHSPSGSAMNLMQQRRWPDAAREFRIILTPNSEPGLWVQYGHALKECGYMAAARQAYQHAATDYANSAELALQLGHLEKVQGNFHRAATYYEQSLSDPRATDAIVADARRETALLTPLLKTKSLPENDELQIAFSCIANDPRSAGGIVSNGMLGKANYSYWFACQGFIRAAEQLDRPLAQIAAPHACPDAAVATRSRRTVHLAFYPPQSARLLKGAHNILVFAWEFAVMPDHRPLAHAFSNPAKMFSIFDEIWVASEFAAEAVKKYTKQPVFVVPSPVISQRKGKQAGLASRNLALRSLRDINWVQLAIFPRLQPNFNQNSFEKRKKIVDILNFPSQEKERANVFLSVFNPHDQRKQIKPMIEGFERFLEEDPTAVLILKTSSPDDTNETINGRLFSHQLAVDTELMPPHVCNRIWITNDPLTEVQMQSLFSLSNFYVCTSYAEGQNLPLLESMGLGVVPVSVRHTAMADYLNDNNSVLIAHHERPCPVKLQETYRLYGENCFSVEAQDVKKALLCASQLSPQAYDQMAQAAMETVMVKCGNERLRQQLDRIDTEWTNSKRLLSAAL